MLELIFSYIDLKTLHLIFCLLLKKIRDISIVNVIRNSKSLLHFFSMLYNFFSFHQIIYNLLFLVLFLFILVNFTTAFIQTSQNLRQSPIIIILSLSKIIYSILVFIFDKLIDSPGDIMIWIVVAFTILF